MRLGTINSPAKVNKLWQVIYDSGELAAAVASITISGLNGNTDEEYQLICRFVDDDTTGGYYLRFNNDSGYKYGYQEIKGAAAVASALRDTSEAQINLGYTNTDSNICFSKHLIYAKSGYLRTVLSETAENIVTTTVTNVKAIGQVWNNTTDELTSMVIGALGDKMNIGSRIILLKKVTLTTGIKTGNLSVQGKIINTWQKVYSTILTEAATSLTISNLTGNTDVLYRLRCRMVNGYNGVATILARPNNDSGNNYGYQYIDGSNTTATANRNTAQNGFVSLGVGVALNDLSLGEILIYAKSGYVRTAILKTSYGINGTTVAATRVVGESWNNSVDNITSLVIIASQTNGLGIGTVIELEKLVLS